MLEPVLPLSLLRARPIGMMQMIDQGLMEPRSPEDLNPFLPWLEKQADRID